MKVKLDSFALEPVRAHDTDAGIDLKSPVAFVVAPGDDAVIDTGVHVQLPHATVGMVKSRSSMNIKHGLICEGVIDEGYTGSIRIRMYNTGTKAVCVDRGDKIAQLVVLPVAYEDIVIASELEATERGDNGFGSTGR